MLAACATKRVAMPRYIVLPFKFKLKLSGATIPINFFGIPYFSRFVKVWGNAAALDVVAKAIKKGSFMAIINPFKGTLNMANVPKSTTIKKNNWANQALKIKEASPVKVSLPLDAVMAIAAKTAGGAR